MKHIRLALILVLLAYSRMSAHAASGCSYPGSLDTFTDVVQGQTLTATLYNKLQCAAEKLEVAANGTTGTVILSSGALTLHQQFINGSQFYVADSGSTDAYVGSSAVCPTAYVTGSWINLRPNTANTGAASVNYCSLGVKTITQHDGSTLTDGMLAAGRIYRLDLHSDGTYRMGSGAGAGGGTITGSGTTNKIARWTSSTALGDSILKENGSTLEIGDVSSTYLAHDHSLISGTKTLKYANASYTLTNVRSISFVIGSDTGAALADTDDQLTIWRNNVAAMTITEVWCESDAGSPIINLQRDDGSPANILSSNLTCTTGGATGSIDTNEDNLAVGDKIDFVMVTAGGTAKRVTVNIKATLD
jgi:hypothetical protein